MPAPFLPCSGEPTVPFSTWLCIFENYLTAIHATGNSWPEARCRTLLLHALGFEGQRFFYTLPNTSTLYDEAIVVLELQFAPKVNVLVARHQLRQRAQRTDENVPQSLAALYELVVSCAYGPMKSEMLWDQLIERAYAPEVRG